MSRNYSSIAGLLALGMGAMIPNLGRPQTRAKTVEEIKESGVIPKYLITPPSPPTKKEPKKKRLKKPQGRRQ